MTVEDLKEKLFDLKEKKAEYEALIDELDATLLDEIKKNTPLNEEFVLNLVRMMKIYQNEVDLLKKPIYDLNVQIYLNSTTFEIKDDLNKNK